jgi:uncharacterized protein YhdP
LASLALHFLIVPRIIDWRTEIEDAASQAWGVQVSIGQLSSVSDGLVPSFEVSDFVLRNAQGDDVLHLPKLRASLSPASLLQLSLERIELDGPVLEVRRNADGAWRVAGIDLGAGESSAFADWLLRQPELRIAQGQVRWVDDLLQQAPVQWSDVNLLMRNGLRSHDIRLDANPPPSWGQRISLQGEFTQAFLNRHASDLRTWRGRVYAELPQLELAPWGVYAKAMTGLSIDAGSGWVRVWADWDRGEWLQPTLDLGLSQLRLHWLDEGPVVAVQTLSGRMHLQPWLTGLGHEVRLQDFKLTLEDGDTWASAQTRLAWHNEGEQLAQKGELQMDSVDLAVLTRMAERMPLNAEWRANLKQAKPQGQMQQLDLRWFDIHTPALQYNAKGQIKDLQMLHRKS